MLLLLSQDTLYSDKPICFTSITKLTVSDSCAASPVNVYNYQKLTFLQLCIYVKIEFLLMLNSPTSGRYFLFSKMLDGKCCVRIQSRLSAELFIVFRGFLRALDFLVKYGLVSLRKIPQQAYLIPPFGFISLVKVIGRHK